MNAPDRFPFLMSARLGLHGKDVFFICLMCFIPVVVLLRVLADFSGSYLSPTKTWPDDSLEQCLFYMTSLIWLVLLVRIIHKLTPSNWMLTKHHFSFKSSFLALSISFVSWCFILWITALSFSLFSGSAVGDIMAPQPGAVLYMAMLVLFEEFFFRAYLLQQSQAILQDVYGAVLLVSVAFALIHLTPGKFSAIEQIGLLAYYFIVSVVLCLFTILSNGLAISIGIHFANNLCTMSFPQSFNLLNGQESSCSLGPFIFLSVVFFILNAGMLYWVFLKTNQILHYKILFTTPKI